MPATPARPFRPLPGRLAPRSRPTRPQTARATAALLVTLLAPGLLATACAPKKDTASKPATVSSAETGDLGGSDTPTPGCTPAGLQTRSPGRFTFGTDKPAYPPWFLQDKPSNGTGYEGAVAAAVAKKLGYPTAQVTWIVASFNSVIQPGPKKFDADINQVSITPARAKVVDFSTGYYDVSQAVIALKSSRYAKATSLAALKGAKLGVQVGTTSYTAIVNQIRTGKQPAVFDSNDVAKQALKNGQVDGLVTDLPTAFYITGAEIQNARIVGQVPLPAGAKEQFGMVLDKGSPLTACVSKAVDALRADGTLAKLQTRWLAGAGAPVLK